MLLLNNMKTKVKTRKQQKLKSHADNLKSKLPSDLQKCMELSQEKAASIWITALPINAHSGSLFTKQHLELHSHINITGPFITSHLPVPMDTPSPNQH